MIDLRKTSHHRVYKTEKLGDALVVTLQGDSPGFGIAAVQSEMSTVINLAKSPEVHNLIVDISGSNYYGSLILGEIVNLGQVVRDKGGRIALAGASSDMKEILRMMRLDAMWERYPTRTMALRALANLPWHAWLRPYAKQTGMVGGVVLLLLLYLYMPRKDYTRDYYQETKGLWNEAKSLKSKGASDTDWLYFTKKADGKLKELTKRLEKIAGSHNEAGRCLLYVVRDYAPKALTQQLNPQNEETILADFYLAMAKAFLDKKEPPSPPDILIKTTGAPIPLPAEAINPPLPAP
jgi:anti-anti-sigma factor